MPRDLENFYDIKVEEQVRNRVQNVFQTSSWLRKQTNTLKRLKGNVLGTLNTRAQNSGQFGRRQGNKWPSPRTCQKGSYLSSQIQSNLEKRKSGVLFHPGCLVQPALMSKEIRLATDPKKLPSGVWGRDGLGV